MIRIIVSCYSCLTTAPHFKFQQEAVAGRKPLGGYNPPAIQHPIPGFIKPNDAAGPVNEADPLDSGKEMCSTASIWTPLDSLP